MKLELVLIKGIRYIMILLLGGLLFSYLFDTLVFVATFFQRDGHPLALRIPHAAWVVGIRLGWVASKGVRPFLAPPVSLNGKKRPLN